MIIRPVLLAAVVVLAAALGGCAVPEVLGGGGGRGSGGDEGEGEATGTEGEGEATGTGTEGEGEGGGGVVGTLARGAACDCDDDCAGTAANPGLCALGVCMQLASTATCAEVGGTAGCAAGSRCWPLVDGGEGVCWPDCDALDGGASGCGGACDADGSCSFTEASVGGCDQGCSDSCALLTGGGGTEGEGEPVTPGVCEGGCDAGFVCGAAGHCMLDVNVVPTGPVPSCPAATLPALDCDGDEAFCGELVTFDPRNGVGYEDYPLNGETSANQYRSFVRRDLRQMITSASAAVACLAANFPGNGGDLMLGDMSEADGSIPGTSDGSPGHPAQCHERGYDMDIGYYQVNTSDNRLRPVCDDGGQEHCTSEPYNMDIWRTALFIGLMQESDQFRAIAVDGKAGALVSRAGDQLCAAGWLTGRACREGLGIVYDRTEAEDIGWFYFHHHHFHVTIFDKNGGGLPNW